MAKKYLLIAVLLLFAVGLIGCGGSSVGTKPAVSEAPVGILASSPKPEQTPVPTPEPTIKPTPEQTPKETGLLVSGVTSEPKLEQTEGINPYFEIFSQLFEDDKALNEEIKYIAVDLDEVKSEDNREFLLLMHDFCDKEGYVLLENNFEGLKKAGLIKELYFEEGIIISFRDESFSENKLVTEASKWRSGLGAIGALYTVEKREDIWEIIEVGNFWIS